MAGKLVGQVIARHDRGFGWIKDETPGSPTQNTVIFYHQKFVNGGKYVTTGNRIAFDLVPDPVHAGQTMAGNIDLVEVAPAETKVGA